MNTNESEEYTNKKISSIENAMEYVNSALTLMIYSLDSLPEYFKQKSLVHEQLHYVIEESRILTMIRERDKIAQSKLHLSLPKRRVVMDISSCDDCPHCEGGTLSAVKCSLTNTTFVNSNGHKTEFYPVDGIAEDCPLEVI